MRSNKEFLSAVYEKAEKGKAKRASRIRVLTSATSLLLAVCILGGTAVYVKKMQTPDTPEIDVGDLVTDDTPDTSDVTSPQKDETDPSADVVKVASGPALQNLLSGIKSEDPKIIYNLESLFNGSSDFAFEMIRSTYDGENIFISPYSIITALAMTANGADGKTRTEIENAIGLTVDEMNLMISSYAHRCSSLNSANSFWMRNGSFLVKKAFLSNLDKYYDAGVYAAPFDESTLNDINEWISEHTDAMIPKALDEIPESAVAYIINTLLFESEWRDQYIKSNNRTLTFTAADGTLTEGEFMCGTSDLIELDYATGISKEYNTDGGISFVALLPNDGYTVEDIIASLDSETLAEAMETGSRKNYKRCAAESIPKFTAESSLELSDVLKESGILSAFDPCSADFSSITDSISLNISRVIHKTAFDINEEGSRAAAATIVEIFGECETEIPDDREEVPVIFDRPFVYMIANDYGFPLFIGVCNSIE